LLSIVSKITINAQHCSPSLITIIAFFKPIFYALSFTSPLIEALPNTDGLPHPASSTITVFIDLKLITHSCFVISNL